MQLIQWGKEEDTASGEQGQEEETSFAGGTDAEVAGTGGIDACSQLTASDTQIQSAWSVATSGEVAGTSPTSKWLELVSNLVAPKQQERWLVDLHPRYPNP